MRGPGGEFQANRIAVVSHLNHLESYCTSKFQKVLTLAFFMKFTVQ